MPLFSVIIPTFNRADLLMETLASVAGQTCDDYEILVVDGGSDDTPDRVAKSFPQARLLRQTDCGPGPARNMGSRHAVGEYHVYLDSDDLWFPWTLETLRQAVERHRPAVMFYQVYRFSRREELAHVARSPSAERVFEDVLSLDQRGLYQGSCALAVRGDVFQASGGFVAENCLGEDLDYVMRLGLAGPVVVAIQPPLVGYRLHTGSNIHLGARNYQGMKLILAREAAGVYPGGKQRRPDRLRAIGDMMRNAIAQFVFKGQFREAILLYARSFPIFLRIRRWRSLFGLPLLPLVQLLRRRGQGGGAGR
jgi:glycosyltransferase involved in cell wall biosynthesis